MVIRGNQAHEKVTFPPPTGTWPSGATQSARLCPLPCVLFPVFPRVLCGKESRSRTHRAQDREPTKALSSAPPFSDNRSNRKQPATSFVAAPPASKFDLYHGTRSMRAPRSPAQGEVFMALQVILYFDDQADALRFALAAGSVMAGDGTLVTGDLLQETARVTRIRLDAANKGKFKPNPPERVA
jgi:hypothetical protein